MKKEILTKDMQSDILGGCGGGVPMFDTPRAYWDAIRKGRASFGDGSLGHSMQHWFGIEH